jgi:hypothetical protein
VSEDRRQGAFPFPEHIGFLLFTHPKLRHSNTAITQSKRAHLQ